MRSRTRSRKPASIGSNHSSRRPTAISPSEPRTGNFVLLLVMAWSPPAYNAGIVWVSAPGDYATFNSNHTPDGTRPHARGPVKKPSPKIGQFTVVRSPATFGRLRVHCSTRKPITGSGRAVTLHT